MNHRQSFQLQRNFPTSAKLSNFSETFQLQRNFPTSANLSNFDLSNFSFFPTALSNYTYPQSYSLWSIDYGFHQKLNFHQIDLHVLYKHMWSTCGVHVEYMLVHVPVHVKHMLSTCSSTCNHVGVNWPIKMWSREKTNHSIFLEIKKRFYKDFFFQRFY